MKLLTKQIERQLAKAPLYSTEDSEEKKIICKFFFGSFTWYVIEAELQENGDWLFFGIVDNAGNKEYGYFTQSQLQSVTWRGWHCVERDVHFKPTVIKNINKVSNL